MKNSLLTILRSKTTSLHDFRQAANKLSHMIATEIAAEIKELLIPVETTLAKTNGYQISQNVVLLPILRSGLALLEAFLYYFQDAKIGLLGLQRDEKTAIPHLYYQKIPEIGKEDLVLILDPMIATGKSTLTAIKKAIEHGATPSHITLVGIVAAPEGIRAIESEAPDVKLNIVSIDEKLNCANFIIPGLGDFGDRYFGF